MTSSTVAATAAADIVERSKSESDLKKYRLLTLPNALQVLLISTEDVPRHAGDDEDDDNDDDEDDDDEDSDDGSDDGDESMSEDDEHGGDGEEGDEEGGGGAGRRAGACLTVGVGSYAEPAYLPGLAHYLEHMVFMGACVCGGSYS